MTPRIQRQAAHVACLFFFLGLAGGPLAAQSHRNRPVPQYVQIGKPDQEKGRQILESFRKRGLYAGDNYFEFELRVMPRRGEERTVPGRMWTGDLETGPVFRFVIHPGVTAHEQRLLVENAAAGRIWSWRSAEAPSVSQLPPEASFQPLAGTDVTAFDLQLGYLYWPEFVYEGVSKVRGRPADTFLLYPPAEVAKAAPNLTGVRVYLDSQYEAPVQAEYLGEGGKAFKSVAVVDLKRVEDQWVVKSIDFRDEASRNKTRFSLSAAAVGLDTSAAVFEPDMLAQPIQPPRQDRLRPIER